MRIIVALLNIIFFITAPCTSQIIEASINWDGFIELNFNTKFIEEKNIERIECVYSSKNPNQPIRSSNEVKYYEFSNSGILITFYHKQRIGNLTLVNHDIHSYDDQDRLTYSTIKDDIGYVRKHYARLNDSLIISSYRSDSFNPSSSPAKIDSTLINTETKHKIENKTYTYNKNKIQTKTHSEEYNSYGLVEKEILQYNLGNQFITKKFNYNKEGLLSDIKRTLAAEVKLYKFFYDGNDVLKKIETWKDEACVKRLEFIYNADGWIDSSLLQTPSNNHIIITKYSYTFHSS